MANTYDNKLRVSGAPQRLREFLNAKRSPYGDPRPEIYEGSSGALDIDRWPTFVALDEGGHYDDDAVIQGQIGFRYSTRRFQGHAMIWLATQHPKLIFDWRFYDFNARGAGMWILQDNAEPEGDQWSLDEIENLAWDESMGSYPGIISGAVADMFCLWFGTDVRRSKWYIDACAIATAIENNAWEAHFHNEQMDDSTEQ
jgi:hypothetical protein